MSLRPFFFIFLKILAAGFGLFLILMTIAYSKFVLLYSGNDDAYLNSPSNISILYTEKKKLDLTQTYPEDWDYLMIVVPYVPYLDDRFDLFWVRFFLLDVFLDGSRQFDQACDLVFFKGRKPKHIVAVGRHVVDFNDVDDKYLVLSRSNAKFFIEKNKYGEFIAVPEIQKKNSQ